MPVTINVNDMLTLLAVAMPVLVPLSLFLYKSLLELLPAAQAAKVEAEVKLLVTAVEQMYKAVPGSGAYKKAEVLRLAQPLGIDPARLSLLIEAAVAALPR